MQYFRPATALHDPRPPLKDDTFSISALHLAIKVPYFSNSGHKNEKVTALTAWVPVCRPLRKSGREPQVRRRSWVQADRCAAVPIWQGLARELLSSLEAGLQLPHEPGAHLRVMGAQRAEPDAGLLLPEGGQRRLILRRLGLRSHSARRRGRRAAIVHGGTTGGGGCWAPALAYFCLLAGGGFLLNLLNLVPDLPGVHVLQYYRY
eukprot:SAG31_NODE_801_length_12013_cov_23.812070_21_plen_205_part_00